ncbi:ArsR/SmtB family transcription factor [Streptomyces melanogenes]|uniref:ArsR/SmtB family transcription factor n=1 Tax=Streptomyces melanogenes TaxID=67326 RepID=UPI00167E47CC|nr:DUF5937 family protein [Streptomyces melanogenes]GGP55475.1 ArsR family transcriptional regulator [Streptomyces melanogenes]
MIEIRLSGTDLSLIRFARSPLEETVHSLAVLHNPRRRALHRPWLDAMLGHIRPLDLDLLFALTGTPHALPDFLCPPPTRAAPTFEEELDTVRATTSEQVRAGIDELRGSAPVSPTLQPLYDDATHHLARLVDQLAAYWRAALHPVWPRLRSLLDADITHRAHCLTTGGLTALFDDIHPDLGYRGDSLHVRKPLRYQRPVTNQGVLLVPTVFGQHLSVLYNENSPPAIGYPARGTGEVWTAAPDTDGTPLEELVGRTRAKILAHLDMPLSTTSVATLVAMTPPTANHHLAVLRRCRLVTSRRSGREVLYQRTDLGTSLLDPPP